MNNNNNNYNTTCECVYILLRHSKPDTRIALGNSLGRERHSFNFAGHHHEYHEYNILVYLYVCIVYSYYIFDVLDAKEMQHKIKKTKSALEFIF